MYQLLFPSKTSLPLDGNELAGGPALEFGAVDLAISAASDERDIRQLIPPPTWP
eukprot:CAMPEP_0117585662 /NCGR_PEP_ID=MMETSP0784-20121206/68274_1 /TAXON_ID=39447 /ORGANISM="" /LENGTH=53 /DNA_ID=CAMNT_0005386643 /DNA_START=474 /DNA_END=635 /DNA_ORIENTATION=-